MTSTPCCLIARETTLVGRAWVLSRPGSEPLGTLRWSDRPRAWDAPHLGRPEADGATQLHCEGRDYRLDYQRLRDAQGLPQGTHWTLRRLGHDAPLAQAHRGPPPGWLRAAPVLLTQPLAGHFERRDRLMQGRWLLLDELTGQPRGTLGDARAFSWRRELVAEVPGLDAPQLAFCLWVYAFVRLQGSSSVPK